MIALIKPVFFTSESSLVNVDLRKMIEKPILRKAKEETPLWCFCNVVEKPLLENGKIYASSANVVSYTAIQLDYDSGTTIDEFVRKFSDKFMFALYTSYNYGYKEGDRFRVIIPLAEPYPQDKMGWAFTRVMESIFEGSDVSCFAKAHFQAVPCLRAEGAPYRFYFNRIHKYFMVPENIIKEYEESTLNVLAYDCAVDDFRDRYCKQDDEEVNYDGILKWCQLQLDAMAEGNRNNTMFTVLTFCYRKGVPLGLIDFDIPADCSDEWDRMLRRIYRYS